MKRVIKSENAASPRGAYSQGWRAGDFVYVSGQVPRDPNSGEVMHGPFKDLVVRTLRNVEAVLLTEGRTLDDVIKFTVILQDLSNTAALNEVFREFLKEPLPARTIFRGDLMGVPIEIDAIAYLPDR
jgi:2-iminobutanoate/2-iminopropanoate deaminase